MTELNPQYIIDALNNELAQANASRCVLLALVRQLQEEIESYDKTSLTNET